MKISYFLTALCAAFVLNVAVSQSAFADQNNNALPTEKSLKADLAAANKIADSDEKKALIDSLQTSLDLLQQIQAQQKSNEALQNTINGADAEIQKITVSYKISRSNLTPPKQRIISLVAWLICRLSLKN